MLNKIENLYFEFVFFLSSTMMSEFDKIIQKSMCYFKLLMLKVFVQGIESFRALRYTLMLN